MNQLPQTHMPTTPKSRRISSSRSPPRTTQTATQCSRRLSTSPPNISSPHFFLHHCLPIPRHNRSARRYYQHPRPLIAPRQPLSANTSPLSIGPARTRPPQRRPRPAPYPTRPVPTIDGVPSPVARPHRRAVARPHRRSSAQRAPRRSGREQIFYE